MTEKSIVSWDERLAGLADEVSSEIGASGGQFFGTRGGMLTFGGEVIPGNEMAVIIVDSIYENAYYTGEFDAEKPAPPVCFAFSRDGKGMSPHELSGTPQCSECAGCEQNEWGSAVRGKGKACKNIRRLALLSIGSFNKAGEFVISDNPLSAVEAGEIGYLKVPVTSVKNFTTYVKTLVSVNRRPPFAVVTKVKTQPDSTSNFKILFEKVADIPNELVDAVLARREAVMATIDFPYQPLEATNEDASPFVEDAPKKSKY